MEAYAKALVLSQWPFSLETQSQCDIQVTTAYHTVTTIATTTADDNIGQEKNYIEHMTGESNSKSHRLIVLVTTTIA